MTAKVNVDGVPALAEVGAVIARVGAPDTLMMTLPDVCPVAVGVVPVPAAGALLPTVAVTVAVTTVCSVVFAMPFVSVRTVVEASEPAVVVKETGALGSGLPFTSYTDADMKEVPPIDPSNAGFALMETRPTAALPTAILTTLLDVAVVVEPVPVVAPPPAPPEIAVMTAVPFEFPALKVVVARPEESVSACDG